MASEILRIKFIKKVIEKKQQQKNTTVNSKSPLKKHIELA